MSTHLSFVLEAMASLTLPHRHFPFPLAHHQVGFRVRAMGSRPFNKLVVAAAAFVHSIRVAMDLRNQEHQNASPQLADFAKLSVLAVEVSYSK